MHVNIIIYQQKLLYISYKDSIKEKLYHTSQFPFFTNIRSMTKVFVNSANAAINYSRHLVDWVHRKGLVQY